MKLSTLLPYSFSSLFLTLGQVLSRVANIRTESSSYTLSAMFPDQQFCTWYTKPFGWNNSSLIILRFTVMCLPSSLLFRHTLANCYIGKYHHQQFYINFQMTKNAEHENEHENAEQPPLLRSHHNYLLFTVILSTESIFLRSAGYLLLIS